MIACASKSDLAVHLWELVGTRYREGGSLPSTGFDCWGFVRYAYARAGIELPDDVYLAGRQFRALTHTDRRQFLDLAYFGDQTLGGRHIGILLDDRWMLHAGQLVNGVARSELTRPPWTQTLRGCYRHALLDH